VNHGNRCARFERSSGVARAGSARIGRFSRDGDDNARAFRAQSLPAAVLRRFIAPAPVLAEI
jgi:hypothetical protein